MLSQIGVVIARTAAIAVRPLENLALWSLRGFDTPRGPTIFLALLGLIFLTLIALLLFGAGSANAALVKIGIGGLGFLLFSGYLRAYLGSKVETEAALCGLMPHGAGVTIWVDPEGMPRPRYPKLLNLRNLLIVLFGLCLAFTCVLAGLLEGGYGPAAIDLEGGAARLWALDWAAVAFWASFGAIDVFGLLPRWDQSLLGVRYEWGWAAALIAGYRLILLGVVFSLVAGGFRAWRGVSLGLYLPGSWSEKEQYFRRLGRHGYAALKAALFDPEPSRREDAARMLGALGQHPEESAAALTKSLRDEAFEVRRQAARSLGALGPAASDATLGLIDRLRDPDVAVRREAAAALGVVAVGRPELATTAVAALAEEVPDDRAAAETMDWSLLAALVQSLTQLGLSLGGGDSLATVALDRLRWHPDEYVRKTALEGYGMLRAAGGRDPWRL